MCGSNELKQALLARGVVIRSPESVWVAADVDPERIAPGVVINAGCRLSGAATLIGPGCVLGTETPATVSNCLLERDVKLAGGSFSDAVFLAGASFGSGAHVRGGTLLEEQASCAHTVGLKQTMLMPFVTLGSLINFCDCLMAGGTDARNHSEVGSSYIHFNFTAHQDKATPSLIGDVPHGVMLASSPIFLGGQGGLVGPRRIAFGTVVAAGTIMRRDVLKPDRLIFGQNTSRLKEVSYDLSAYGDVRRILKNNFIYIANLHALYAWYGFVRPGLMQADMYAQAALEGAKRQIEAMVNERIKRIDQLTAKVAASLEKTGITGGVTQSQSDFVNSWSQARAQLQLNRDGGDEQLREAFLAELQPGDGGYLENLRRQSSAAKDAGLLWLENIVKRVSSMDF